MHQLTDSQRLTPLLDDMGNATVVMLGEASHGTHEYYTWRAAISRRLITEKRFNFIAVEGDWPDCYKINRYVKGSVKKAIACFQPFNENEQEYARFSLSGHRCKDVVIRLLKDIRLRAHHLDGDREAAFNTEQNALIAVNAEKYYSSMIGFDNESWNIRDKHMMETLQKLMQFHGSAAKGLVWEHNTHIGDARATDMTRAGMVNIGQLARLHYGPDKVYLTGFGSYEGTVIAGEEWGAPMEVMDVPPAQRGSIEDLLHHEIGGNCYMLFREETNSIYFSGISHRAIGVVYNPGWEKHGNYVPSVLSRRYNAFIFLDKTSALHPLHLVPVGDQVPETYPFGV